MNSFSLNGIWKWKYTELITPPLQHGLHGLILVCWHFYLGIELKHEKYFIRPGAVGAAGADGAAAKPVTEDDLQNLKDADIEDIGSHR